MKSSKTKAFLFFQQRQIWALLVCSILSVNSLYSQITATTSSTPNTNCNGVDCNYSGPSILINEVMLSPSVNDGSLWSPTCGSISTNGCGEWIELYNPNSCEPVDVSCYHLGNYITDSYTGPDVGYSGGFTIPSGTIIPPNGFLVIRGQTAPSVPSSLLVANGGNCIEIVTSSSNSCVGSGALRLWFPNTAGWFAFYDASGVPQDAIRWGNAYPSDLNGNPCIASSGSCPINGTLVSYNNIPSANKQVVYSGAVPSSWGLSIRRSTDGGSWVTESGASPTQGTCNGTCATPPVVTCTGTATVNPTGGASPYTFEWDDTQLQSSQTATGLCAGNYTVTVTDNNGSTAQFQVAVTDYVPPVSLSINSDVCIDGGILAISGLSPVPGTNETGVLSGSGVTGTSFDPALAGNGQHTITYTFTDDHGCTNSATDQIEVHPLPTPTLTVASAFCESASPVNVTVSPVGGTLTGPGVNGNQFSPALAGTGTHTLTYSYTDVNGCSATVSTGLVVNESPTITVNSETICSGQNTVLTATPSINGGTFIWTPGGQATSSIDVNPTATTSYSVTYSLNGCTATATGIVTVNNTVNAIISTPTTIINAGETISLQASQGDGYLWDTGANTQSINVSPTESTEYCVEVTDNGCTGEDCILIQVISAGCESVLYAPNCITPNGDKINEDFIIQGDCLSEFHLSIFNRWGQLIFESFDINKSWNGTYKDQPVTDGVYTYVIVARGMDNQFYDKQGFVTVIR